MKIKIWLCALAAMLLLTGPAMAEEMNLADIQVRPAPNAYGFPMTVSQCESLGLTVTGEMPEEGCFADMTAADANYEFAVRVDNVKGEMWVTGCTMKNNGAGMGHLQLNATTRAQALELLGAPDTEENGCSVYTAGYGNYVWTLRYDGDKLVEAILDGKKIR